ncbi:TPA: hypothetical protein ACH3X2_013105 [Trebouxia sp. C0005]
MPVMMPNVELVLLQCSFIFSFCIGAVSAIEIAEILALMDANDDADVEFVADANVEFMADANVGFMADANVGFLADIQLWQLWSLALKPLCHFQQRKMDVY